MNTDIKIDKTTIFLCSINLLFFYLFNHCQILIKIKCLVNYYDIPHVVDNCLVLESIE